MRTRRLTTAFTIFSLVVGLAWAGSAAAEPPEPERSGPYAGIGVGFGFDNFANRKPPGFDKNLEVNTGVGIDGWVGYRFNKWVGADLQVEWLDGFDDNKVDGIKVNYEAQLVTFGGNLKVFPLASVLPRRGSSPS